MIEDIPAPPPTEAIHPLEPLSAGELARAAGVLLDSGRAGDPPARIAYVTLEEPGKAELAGWSPGDPVDRRALVVAWRREDHATIEAVVSLTAGEVLSLVTVAGAQAPLLLEELSAAERIVKADPAWRAALAKRGVTNYDRVQVDLWAPGYFGTAVDRQGRRLGRAVAYARADTADNGYAHPFENVLALVDHDRGEVVEVQDHGVVPVPPTPGNYDVASAGPPRADLRPLEIRQPDGPSFTIDGHQIAWQKWQLRVSLHPIEGLVLHQVGYLDGGRVRSILHRAALSEMVVPYGDTAALHWWKNAFDAGEVGLGKLTNSLDPGCDCLGEVRYLDGVMSDEDGRPRTIPRAICVHEEDYGILWKHVDVVSRSSHMRRSRRLVVSAIATVGNYDYGLFWYFYQDGSMQLEIKLSGILQTRAVRPGERPDHAELVAAQLAAPHHQHLFNVRLDFDVDGTANALYEVDLEPAPAGPDNPWGNALVARSTLLASEQAAKRRVNPAGGRYWKVVNPSRLNALGEPVAYKLVPGPTPTLLAHADSWVARRAGFATHNLWATPFHPAERHAAGDYPNQHPGGGGLPAWTAADRPLDNTDLVVWYTFGSNHVARPEDWPVMPVEYVGFTLAPAGFFDRNPALDVPPSTAGGHHT
jgi:primary-amine oxidase